MLDVQDLYYRISPYLALEQISFQVRPGQMLAILGANGAGKSTLLRLLSGAVIPHGGSIYLRELPLKYWASSDRARMMAVMQQQNPLQLPFRVEEVVMMGRYPYFGRVASLNDLQVVDQVLDQADIRHLRTRNYLTLSGGEQQRVHLARVLAQIGGIPEGQYPRFLLMDEPSNNLDIRHQHKALAIAKAFAHQGNCVVTVLHDLNLALQYADQLLLLKQGKQLGFGPVDEVLNSDIISDVYDHPLSLFHHPVSKRPMVVSLHD